MVNVNFANEARRWSDGELAATIRTLTDEQQRRAAIPPEQRPDPKIAKMLQDRHAELYGPTE